MNLKELNVKKQIFDICNNREKIKLLEKEVYLVNSNLLSKILFLAIDCINHKIKICR